jgi:membrane-associated protease RseP (regulator of RpoE activity)
VFVHELGHFLVAKRSGIVVEEFGFGFYQLFKLRTGWYGVQYQCHPVRWLCTHAW